MTTSSKVGRAAVYVVAGLATAAVGATAAGAFAVNDVTPVAAATGRPTVAPVKVAPLAAPAAQKVAQPAKHTLARHAPASTRRPSMPRPSRGSPKKLAQRPAVKRQAVQPAQANHVVLPHLVAKLVELPKPASPSALDQATAEVGAAKKAIWPEPVWPPGPVPTVERRVDRHRERARSPGWCQRFRPFLPRRPPGAIPSTVVGCRSCLPGMRAS